MTTTCGRLAVQAFLVWNRAYSREYGIGVIAHTSMEAKSIFADVSGLASYEVRCELAPAGTPCSNPRGY